MPLYGETQLLLGNFGTFRDPQIEGRFHCYMARKSRGTSILLNSTMVLICLSCVPRILGLPFVPRRVVALVLLLTLAARHSWGAYSLATCEEERHQSIKARVVLQHLATGIVVVAFLNKDELSVRHPTATSFCHGCIICFYQCPLQVTINMYLVSMVSSLFRTANTLLESPQDFGRSPLYYAACIMLANITVGCILPLAGNVILEKKARESFLLEHRLWVTPSGDVRPMASL